MLAWLCSIGVAQPIGQKLPDFEFTTLDGQSVKLSQLRESAPNGMVMLTFWCTTCASCRATEATLVHLAQRYGAEAKVIAIASSRSDSAADIKRYLDRHGVELPVLLDQNSALGRHFGVQRTTTTALIDADGRVRYFGTLLKDKRAYAEEALRGMVNDGRVSAPVGPIYG